MILFVCITIWLFVLLLLGLRPDSVFAAESWPKLPEDKSVRRYWLIISVLAFVTFLFLWFLTAFRSISIGNDTLNYVKMFELLFPNGVTKLYGIEIGYQLLNILILKFTRSGHVFLIVMATIMYAGVGLYIYKFSKNPVVSLCLFFSCFFSVFLCILRQGMAMIIVLFGYQLLKRGKKILAALLFLLAASFHLTALVSFVLFLDFKVWKKQWFVFGLTILCAIISRFGLFSIAVEIIAPKYSHYFNTKYASTGWLAITFYLLSYAVFYFLISKSANEDCRSDRTVVTNFTFLLILTAFGYAINLFDRVGEYFLLIAITEIPNMLYRGNVKHFRLWLFCICSVMLIMFILVQIYRPGWNHLYPYEFWPDSIFAALN